MPAWRRLASLLSFLGGYPLALGSHDLADPLGADPQGLADLGVGLPLVLHGQGTGALGGGLLQVSGVFGGGHWLGSVGVRGGICALK